jgi:hypothetical protein
MPKCPKATSTGTNWGTGRISEGAFFVPSYSEQTILHAYSTETTIQSFGFGDQVEGPKESDLQQSPDLTRGQGLGPRGAGRAPGKMAGMLAANSRIYDWCLEMEPGKGSHTGGLRDGNPRRLLRHTPPGTRTVLGPTVRRPPTSLLRLISDTLCKIETVAGRLRGPVAYRQQMGARNQSWSSTPPRVFHAKRWGAVFAEAHPTAGADRKPSPRRASRLLRARRERPGRRAAERG